MKKRLSLEDELFYISLAALPLGVGAICLYRYLTVILPPIPCFFNTFFHMYCPGCGGTRALSALLHGKILLSVWYHPLVPYTAVIYLGFMITQGLHRIGVKRVQGWKFHIRYLWIALGIIIVNFIVKNILRLCFGILM